MADIDSILAQGIGNSLLQGSTARYHAAETRRIQDEEEGRRRAAPDIPAAMGGDQAALGRVMTATPKLGQYLGPFLAKQTADQQAKLLKTAEFAAGVGGAIISAPVTERAKLYEQAKNDAAAQGIPTANWPAQYDEGWTRMQVFHGKGMLEHMTQGAPRAKAAGAGGDAFDAPSWSKGPGPQSDATGTPGVAAPPVFAQAPGNTPPGTFAPSDAAQEATQPVQTAQASPPAPPIDPQGNSTPIQMAAAGDRVTYPNGTYQSVGPQRPAGYAPNSPDLIKQLPPALQVPGAPNAPPEYWRRLEPGVPTSGAVPLGPQGNPILSLPGTATASVGAAMPTSAVPAGPFPAPATPSPAPVPQEGVTQGVPPGFQPMGHRDPNGQLVPALINGQPVHRNPQTGEMILGESPPAEPVQMAQASPRVAPTPSAPDAVVHEIPPGYEPVRQKGIPYVNKQGYIPLISQNGPTILLKPADQKAEKPQKQMIDVMGPDGKTIVGQRNPATNEYKPITVTPGTNSIDSKITGDDVYQALIDDGQPGRAAEIKKIVEGDAALPSPNTRAPNAVETRRLAFQAGGPDFNDALHGQRVQMKTAMSKGKIGDALTAQGTLFNHLNELQTIAEDLRNTPYPIINKVGNILGLNTGDPRVTNMATIKHRVNEEAEKYFGGSGAVTVSGLAQAQKELNEAQSPEQLQGSVEKLVKLIAGRQSELLGQINRGLAYPKERQLAADDLLTPEAKASRDKILANLPVGPANSIGNKLSGSRPEEAAAPKRLSPQDASKLAPGTPFIGEDGIPRVHH